uniref:Uncharacterized protein n=1 Tax=Sphaerodactylus townsendi TaxID=933632 RepID=A0ACB8GDG2_9SAUR
MGGREGGAWSASISFVHFYIRNGKRSGTFFFLENCAVLLGSRQLTTTMGLDAVLVLPLCIQRKKVVDRHAENVACKGWHLWSREHVD